MRTNNSQGRMICIAISGFMLVKFFINLAIGGFDAAELIRAIVCGFFLITGLEYVNYIIAGVLAFYAIRFLPNNIMHIKDNFIYLLEGIVDIGCAVILCTVPAVKEHFTNKWNDFQSKISKKL